ncbi:MAG TPA: hypothetical protein VGN36_06865 [Sphingorhabdus sp.]|jgi:hypothetical protein|nr:hypothetical protein [Sphingorhabdus sp.]
MAYDYRLRSAVAAVFATVFTFLLGSVAITGNAIASSAMLAVA